MFDHKLEITLQEILESINEKVPTEELNTATGRAKLDALFNHDKPYYVAVVNPLKLSIYYFCPQACEYIGYPDMDYKKANFGLVLKVLAKENMGMVYTGVQHFLSEDKHKIIKLNCKVKRHDGMWRDVYLISKLIDEGNDSKGYITVSIVVDVREYFDHEFKQNTEHENNNFELTEKKLIRINQLSPREKEVLVMYCNEKSVQEISENMHISVHTVRAHKRTIIKKLNTKSPYSLAKYALYIISNPDLMNGGKVDF
ncbi:MAG: helix-turn-helix transcriptional regulator [Chitinophagales bacterium]